MESKMSVDFNILNQWINVDNTSYLEIGRRLGVSGNYVKKLALKLGVNLPKRNSHSSIAHNKGLTKHIYECANCGILIKAKSYRKFCSNKCCGENVSKLKYKHFLENPEEYNKLTIRMLCTKFIQ